MMAGGFSTQLEFNLAQTGLSSRLSTTTSTERVRHYLTEDAYAIGDLVQAATLRNNDAHRSDLAPVPSGR